MSTSIKFDFPLPTKTDWLDKINQDLKGKAISELDWLISDHVAISPFKDCFDLTQSYLPINGRPDNAWDIVEPIIISKDVTNHNQTILSSLDQGATSIALYITSLLTVDYFKELFQDVLLDLISVELIVPNQELSVPVYHNYVEFLEKSTYDKSKTKGIITISDNDVNNQSYQLSSPSLSLHSVNGCIYFDGSRSIINELASILFCFHQRIEYILSESKSGKLAEQDLYVSIFLDDIYLLNIAKIRALKKLHARLLEAYSLPSRQLKIKGSVAAQSMGQNVNINRIKASSIALSAVSGGIDSLELYNDGLIDVNNTEEYNRRIARNINHILAMEGYLDRVIDPAAGSYYLEFLTDTLAKESWSLFQNKWRETN